MKWSHSVVSDSLRPHGLWPIRLFCPRDFPGKSAGVDCHFLLQGIFPTQELNPGSPALLADALPSEPPGGLPSFDHCARVMWDVNIWRSWWLYSENIFLPYLLSLSLSFSLLFSFPPSPFWNFTAIYIILLGILPQVLFFYIM